MEVVFSFFSFPIRVRDLFRTNRQLARDPGQATSRESLGLLQGGVDHANGQVVLQVQHLLLPPEAALMPGHPLALMPDLRLRGIHLDLYFHAHRHRRPVEVRQHLHAAAVIDHRILQQTFINIE